MQKQKLLILYAANGTVKDEVIGHALYDPTDNVVPTAVDTPMPYGTVFEAMKDGWRVIQYPALGTKRGFDLETDYLEYEFVLEKLVDGQ